MNTKAQDVECAVVGGILLNGLNGEVRDVLSWLKPEMFTNPYFRRYYHAIGQQAQRDCLVDMVMLSNDFDIPLSDLADICKNSIRANLTGYARKVKSLWVNREAGKVMVNAATQLEIARTDAEAASAVECGMAALAKIMQSDESVRPVVMNDLIESYVDVYEKRALKDHSHRLLHTGIKALDKILGGINRTDLVLMAGRSGMGKTELGLTVARNIVENNGTVLFFSLEMSNVQLLDRIVSSRAKVSVNKLRDPVTISDDENMRIAQYLESARGYKLYFCDRSGLSADQICAMAQRQQEQGELSAIVIDYLGLIRHHNPNNNLVQAISDTTWKLKTFAKNNNIPVILLAQLSRKVEDRGDKRPVNSDLRDSGAIEQDADRIIMLYREKAYNKQSDNHYSEAIVTKNRYGEQGTAYMVFRNGHFEDCDQAQAAEYCSRPPVTKQGQPYAKHKDNQRGF